MALRFVTGSPGKLLETFKKAVDDGHIKTWSYDSDGDFTLTSEQWIRHAWLRPKIIENRELLLRLVRPKESKVSSLGYAVYHAQFIQSALRHCDTLFDEVRASAMPEMGDSVG